MSFYCKRLDLKNIDTASFKAALALPRGISVEATRDVIKSLNEYRKADKDIYIQNQVIQLRRDGMKTSESRYKMLWYCDYKTVERVKHHIYELAQKREETMKPTVPKAKNIQHQQV